MPRTPVFFGLGIRRIRDSGDNELMTAARQGLPSRDRACVCVRITLRGVRDSSILIAACDICANHLNLEPLHCTRPFKILALLGLAALTGLGVATGAISTFLTTEAYLLVPDTRGTTGPRILRHLSSAAQRRCWRRNLLNSFRCGSADSLNTALDLLTLVHRIVNVRWRSTTPSGKGCHSRRPGVATVL